MSYIDEYQLLRHQCTAKYEAIQARHLRAHFGDDKEDARAVSRWFSTQLKDLRKKHPEWDE